MNLSNEAIVPFKDVSTQDWYYESVSRAYDAGLVKGIDPDHFAPNARITRE
ncbi:S-layer homology domain-containing protein [Effusibacillus consociatus]|uniref:S-layer homology domain-containing protein n=1 Tax=Effusibacillus consociatus TaxID=1117041 RepID=A0ABV9Q6Y7_9BACL